jgi:response regulator of citrate/malate metabolism
MNMIHLSIPETDFPFLMEAISLRALSLQNALRQQRFEQNIITGERTVNKEEASKKVEEIIKKAKKPQAAKPKTSLKERRDALQALLSTKEGRFLPIAEIARRTGVSYVTARKAVITKRKN